MQTGVLKNCQEYTTVRPDGFAFAVASVTQGADKTLEIERLSAAKQHMAWRHFRAAPL
jgi:hypothetical protein